MPKLRGKDAASRDVKAKAPRKGKRPVPGTFTAEKRQLFLEAYAKGGTVAMAAKKVGVSSVTVFKHIRTDATFKEHYRLAMDLNTDQLEDHLHLIAAAGNITAIFGTLKARRPEKWRENFKLDHTNSDGSFKAFAAGMVIASKEMLNDGADSATPSTAH